MSGRTINGLYKDHIVLVSQNNLDTSIVAFLKNKVAFDVKL